MTIQTADITCKVGSCRRSVIGKSMCRRHYDEFRYYGRHMVSGSRDFWRETVTSAAVHLRCRALWGKASEHACIECDGGADEWAYDGTDPTELYGMRDGGSWVFYSRFPEFYMPMCRSCHRRRDGATAKAELQAYRTLLMSQRDDHRQMVGESMHTALFQ